MSPHSIEDVVVFLFLALFYILGGIQAVKGWNLETFYAYVSQWALWMSAPQVPCLGGSSTWFNALLLFS